jgi:hypothetical protein
LRGLLVAGLLLCGCATVQTAGTLRPGTTPNDVFLIEVTDTMPSEPYGFVSVSVVEASRGGDLAARLSDSQIDQMKETAASFGAEMLVIERQDTPRRRAFYGFGMRRTDPPSGALKDLTSCSHPDLVAALTAARTQVSQCLARAHARRPALRGSVRVLLLVDALGGVYRAAIAPESTRDGEMGGCGLSAAHDTNFGHHGDVLCRTEFQASL